MATASSLLEVAAIFGFGRRGVVGWGKRSDLGLRGVEVGESGKKGGVGSD